MTSQQVPERLAQAHDPSADAAEHDPPAAAAPSLPHTRPATAPRPQVPSMTLMQAAALVVFAVAVVVSLLDKPSHDTKHLVVKLAMIAIPVFVLGDAAIRCAFYARSTSASETT